MALISVGIHENLKLSSDTKVNDHGTLELAIESVQDTNALLNAFTNNTTFDSMKSSFRFYPPNLKDYDGNVKTAPAIAQDLLKMRSQFMQYALLFGTEEEANVSIGGMQMFMDLGIAEENLAGAINQLTNEAFMKKVVTNLATKFVNYLKGKDAFSGVVKFRHKFMRQSKDKNYATIPNSTFDTWVEAMVIPKSASKVAYSKWEIDNKKNDGTAAASDKPVTTSAADLNKSKNLFGAPTGDVPAGQPNLGLGS